MWLQILYKSHNQYPSVLSWIAIWLQNHRSGSLAEFLYHIVLDLQTPVARNSGVQWYAPDLYTACLHSCSSAVTNGHACWSNAPAKMLISLHNWPWLTFWVAPGSHTLLCKAVQSSTRFWRSAFKGEQVYGWLRDWPATDGWLVLQQYWKMAP